MRSISLVTVLMLACAGCQSVQVRKHSVELDAEVPTLYNQLVLDNVAMAISAPDNLPYFGLAAQSTNANSRQVSMGATPNWTSAITRSISVPFMGSDQDQATIQLTPVNDSNKLELLHELFRAAACACCYNERQDEFVALKRYYGAHSKAYVDYSKGVFWVDLNNPLDTTGKPPQPRCVAATACIAAHMEPGTWPTKYLLKPCWFCVTDKHGVPKDACVVGNYCDTYVWVPRDHSADLRLLTMAALDIASIDLTQITLGGPSPNSDLRADPREIPYVVPPPPVTAPLF